MLLLQLPESAIVGRHVIIFGAVKVGVRCIGPLRPKRSGASAQGALRRTDAGWSIQDGRAAGANQLSGRPIRKMGKGTDEIERTPNSEGGKTSLSIETYHGSILGRFAPPLLTAACGRLAAVGGAMVDDAGISPFVCGRFLSATVCLCSPQCSLQLRFCPFRRRRPCIAELLCFVPLPPSMGSDVGCFGGGRGRGEIGERAFGGQTIQNNQSIWTREKPRHTFRFD